MRTFSLLSFRRRNTKFCLAIVSLLSAFGLFYQYQNPFDLLNGALEQLNTTAETKGSSNGESNIDFDVASAQTRDWHDYVAMARDSLRVGVGEQGEATPANWTCDVKQSQGTGFNAQLSDFIALERALPDSRHVGCLHLKYPLKLPAASVIIACRNEHASVLLRTIYSILNRTPTELLQEILVVDDLSDPEYHGPKFQTLITRNPPQKVRIIHLNKRMGLMGARVVGARQAKGAVLVFVDAHVEATHNWLPPLLAPIVADRRTCTTPIIDTIAFDTFEYIAAAPSRGGFNWQFNYVQFPLLKEERRALPAPHNNPVMNGGLFAIDAEFFWYLGAYDEGLKIWGAEQFELSFKIWMCGGRLLEVPCSRLGHLYRDPAFRVQYSNQSGDFITKNYKRVAEVWLDEYKDALYEHVPKLTQTRVTDLSAQHALRKRLKCKSFKWYLQNVATDILRVYPALEPVDFASGAVQSLAATELCLDTQNIQPRKMLPPLQRCASDLKHPYYPQHWHLSFRRDLQQNGNCLEVQSWESRAPLWYWPCHHQGGNQFWYYDRQTQMLVNGYGEMERRCLELDLQTKEVFVSSCDFAKVNMKWGLGYVNQSAMNKFFNGLNLDL